LLLLLLLLVVVNFRELALRFFAMLRSSERYKMPLNRFLNQVGCKLQR
jgi:hypothetical protein